MRRTHEARSAFRGNKSSWFPNDEGEGDEILHDMSSDGVKLNGTSSDDGSWNLLDHDGMSSALVDLNEMS